MLAILRAPKYQIKLQSDSSKKYNTAERKAQRRQQKDKTIYIPAYVQQKDQAQRQHTTQYEQHRIGIRTFWWWPKVTQRQLKKDGYSMQKDTIQRFDESSTLIRRMGYIPEYEYLGIERIRAEHYTKLFDKRTTLPISRGNGPLLPDNIIRSIVSKQPVWCVLGSVNHGKTTLIDTLINNRDSNNIIDKEVGYITQDINIYQINLIDNDIDNKYQLDTLNTMMPKLIKNISIDILNKCRKITLIDTPGHKSFYDARENSSLFADAILLIICAIEGITEQTQECLQIIKDFKLPYGIVITKCDDINAKPEDILKELALQNIQVIPWDTLDIYTTNDNNNLIPCIFISSHTRFNINNINRMIYFMSLVIQPKVDLLEPPNGIVQDGWNEVGGRGITLKVLSSSGIIRIGDDFISGPYMGKIRSLFISEDFNDFKVWNNNIQDTSIILKKYNPNNLIINRQYDDTIDIKYTNKIVQHKGKKKYMVQYILPGIPFEINGIYNNTIPKSGDDFRIVPNSILAKQISNYRHCEIAYPQQERFILNDILPSLWKQPPTPDELSNASKEQIVDTLRSLDPKVLECTAGVIPSSSLSSPDTIVNKQILSNTKKLNDDTTTYKRCIIKCGNITNLTMIRDSIDAYNRQWPEYSIKIEFLNVGTIIPTDIVNAKLYNCPVYTFRIIDKISKSILKLAIDNNVKIYQYDVFDDLFKDIFSIDRFHILFGKDSKISIRPYDTPVLNFKDIQTLKTKKNYIKIP